MMNLKYVKHHISKQKVWNAYKVLREAVDDTYWDDDFKTFEKKLGLQHISLMV